MTESVDTTNQSTVREIDNSTFYNRVQDTTTVEFSFVISVLLLLVASFLKYFITNLSTKKEWWLFSVEFPIDLCLVILTLIVTLYIKENMGGALIFLTVAIIIIILCCISRRAAMKHFDSSDSKSLWTGVGYTVLTIFLSIAYCAIIYHVII